MGPWVSDPGPIREFPGNFLMGFQNEVQTFLGQPASKPASQPASKKCRKSVPRHVPTYVKIHENTLPTRPKKVTCAHRESNRPPPASKSEGLPTRLFRPQNIASVKILYASKIRGVCVRARRGFFRAQNSDFGFFRTQNSEF